MVRYKSVVRLSASKVRATLTHPHRASVLDCSYLMASKKTVNQKCSLVIVALDNNSKSGSSADVQPFILDVKQSISSLLNTIDE